MRIKQLFGRNFRFVPKVFRQKADWIKQGGTVTRFYPILDDFTDKAGNAKGHYFHQDLLVASFLHERKPVRHIDVGSRVDGFVAHVAAFREIDVFDIRALPQSAHKNIRFTQSDFISDSSSNLADSVSCLHAIEHFGLGRYGDPIDVEGHTKGVDNLVRMLKNDGHLYISFPIGKSDQVFFNAHRVFHPQSILEFDAIKKNLNLVRFDYVDDAGDLHLDCQVSDVVGKVKYGCGIYTFHKNQ